MFVESDEQSLKWMVDFDSGDRCNKQTKRDACEGPVLNCVPASSQCNFLHASMSDQHWEIGSDGAGPRLALALDVDDDICKETHLSSCKNVLILLHYSIGKESGKARKEKYC